MVVVLAVVAAAGFVVAALEWLNRAARKLPMELRMRPLQRRGRPSGSGRVRELAQLEALADAAARGDRTAGQRLAVRLAALGVEIADQPTWAELAAAAQRLRS